MTLRFRRRCLETPSQTKTPEFKKWFSNQGLVGPDGQPLKFYHGTRTPQELRRFIAGGGVGSHLSGDAYGVGSYFTTSPGEASAYAKDDGAVFPVYIRGHMLDIDADQLPNDQVAQLTQFANQHLLPSDKARFDVGRKTREFTDADEAREFFDNQRANWETFGDGMDRAFPKVEPNGAGFSIEYTDFDAAVEIRTGKDAETLFKAIGWDNVPSAGYDGLLMKRSGGQKWVVMFNPDGNVKSATGNNGNFDGMSRNIDETKSQTQTPEFKRWFGNSKVVDASGRPERVYHVTVYGDFNAFDKNSQRKGMAGYGFYFTDILGVNIYADYGANFQADRDWKGNPKRVNVMPVYLSMQNPLIVGNIADIKTKYGHRDPGQFGQGREYAGMNNDTLTAIERDGYDGVISTEYVKRMRNSSYKIVEPGTKGAIAHPVYVVFDPKQIKSAIGNSGKFDPTSANLTDSVEDEEQEVARLQAELDIATAALKTDKSNVNVRAVQRLRQQVDIAQARLDSAKAAEVPSVASDDYRGEHRPPGPDDGAAAFDLTMNDIYPNDVYGPRGAMEYGQGDEVTARKIIALHNRPDAWVWVYRALPKGVPLTTHTAFRPGDWVTTDKDYAVEHGESNLGDGYGIARKRVRASEIFTNGDSLHEWGYWPQAKTEAVQTSESVVTAYHGTRNGGFDDFKPNFRKGEQLGFGIHFAADRDFAARYAHDDDVARKGKAPMVYTVQLTMNAPLKADQVVRQGTPEFALAKRLAGSKLYVSKDEDGTPCCYMQNAIDSTSPQRAEKLIRDAGFDSVIYQSKIGRRAVGGTQVSGKSESYIVFEPSQIRVVSKESVTEREAPSFRKPSTPEFKAWFGRSKCTQVQYHTTPADFDEFDTGRSDLGAHFGSLEQATKRATTLAGRPGDAWSTMPCWLSVQNPLRLKDEGSFHADAIVWQLAKKGIITRADAKQIEDAIYDDWETRKEYDPKMVAAIKKAGYDGIVYKNEHEGAGDSWIVFDPNQIKSAIGNSGSFDPNSGKVTDAVHADIAVATIAHRLA